MPDNIKNNNVTALDAARDAAWAARAAYDVAVLDAADAAYAAAYADWDALDAAYDAACDACDAARV